MVSPGMSCSSSLFGIAKEKLRGRVDEWTRLRLPPTWFSSVYANPGFRDDWITEPAVSIEASVETVVSLLEWNLLVLMSLLEMAGLLIGLMLELVALTETRPGDLNGTGAACDSRVTHRDRFLLTHSTHTLASGHTLTKVYSTSFPLRSSPILLDEMISWV